jgi:ABC-type lipoprotein export system ATPase subunit
MSLLKEIADERDIILIIVTHNMDLARSAPRRFELKNGTLNEKES